jgi:hypothetical protein
MTNDTWGTYTGKVLGFSFEDPTTINPPYYHPAEQEFVSAMQIIVRKYGKLKDYDDKGLWVGYESRAENENYSKGVRCENCAQYESKNVCKIIERAIEPGGYCRFAAIPSEKINKKKS